MGLPDWATAEVVDRVASIPVGMYREVEDESVSDPVDADESTGGMRVWLEPSLAVEAEVADSVLPGRSVGLA